jgi:hypothetical protein
MISDEGLRRVFTLSAFLVASFFFTNVAFNHFASFFAWMVVAITLASASQAQRPLSPMASGSTRRMTALSGLRA